MDSDEHRFFLQELVKRDSRSSWRLPRHISNKAAKPRLRFAPKVQPLPAPHEAHGARVQRVVRQQQPLPPLRREAILHQRQIMLLVIAVKFVADDWVAEMGE